MYLLTLITGIVLLHEAHTLRCYECIPGSTGTCTQTTTQCHFLANRCAVIRSVAYSGSSVISDIKGKSCALPEECGELSIDYGHYGQILWNSICCTTDLCNTQAAPAVSSPSVPNGKKCYSCDGQKCTSTINCKGNQDRCIKDTVDVEGQKVIMKGCASKALCSYTRTAQLTRATVTETTCCEGNLCNSASSTSAGLLLLVTPLISLILN